VINERESNKFDDEFYCGENFIKELDKKFP